MDRITKVRIKYIDGTYSEEMPVGTLIENILYNQEHSLRDILGEVQIDTKGSLQDQIDSIQQGTVTNLDISSTYKDGVVTLFAKRTS